MHLEEKKRDRLKHENDNLRELCDRKAKSISHFRSFGLDAKTFRETQVFKNNKSLSKEENPESARTFDKNIPLELNLNKRSSKESPEKIDDMTLELKPHSSRAMASTRPFTLRERFNPKRLSSILG